MDALVAQPASEKRLLPALAEAIGEWFPELGGRSIAVSEVDITKENVPTLPLAMVAFIRSTSDPSTKARVSNFEIGDTIVVDFWLEPARYKRANGTETPFWSYYDYEAIRDKLLTKLVRWESPNGEIVTYRGLTIEATQLAVTLTFTFMVTFRWCPDEKYAPDSIVGKIPVKLCVPTECCIPECMEDDPCP